MLAFLATAIIAQGTVAGRVTDAQAAPLMGVTVSIEGTRLSAVTDGRGAFVLRSVTAGRQVVLTRLIGYDARRDTITVVDGETTRLDLRLTASIVLLDAVVVSATGERERLATTPAAMGAVQRDELQSARPAHPSEIMNRMAGVWVNMTGGEGHTMAIRQPLTTDPVYLYLEDGIPSRSTGFFNHNALYEINLPQADGIEVIKGPGTALYGSDAIGGVVNVNTRAPSRTPELGLSAEGGAWGFGRLLASASNTFGDHGLRLDANYTRTDGWRRSTSYDRQSVTARWDRYFGGGRLKTVIAWSDIDQSTAGSSAILAKDFQNFPTFNYTPISYRKVRALRVSSAYERQGARSLLSLTPYARVNSMAMIPNWTLSFDPQVSKTENTSLGLLARYRYDFGVMDARLIIGADVDYSPGNRFERIIGTTSYQRTVDSSAAGVTRARVFTAYRDSTTVYDYDVTFHGVSPYAHVEMAPVAGLRLTAGARYDVLGYSYNNQLSDTALGGWRRPADTTLSYRRLSPKLGATYSLGAGATVFAAFRAGFRAPSEGQLFRQGSSDSTVALAPVKVENYEVGVRGRIARVSYDVAAYTMRKYDDILSFTNGASTATVNAGETHHHGVEVTLGLEAAHNLVFTAAYTYGRQTYERWVLRAASDTIDFSGNDIDVAPRGFGSARVRWTPALLAGGDIVAEVSRMGWYWMAPLNVDITRTAHIYYGHTLVNLRASWVLRGHTTVFTRVMNLTNRRYAERATFTAARGEEFSPGLPRTFYLGVQYQ